MNIVGLSAFYHDSAAALLCDGELVAAAQEERFTRRKHDPGFPEHALKWCLGRLGGGAQAIDLVVFYDKPWLTFERMLESFVSAAPRGLGAFLTAMPAWMGGKFNLRGAISREIRRLLPRRAEMPPILFTQHHQSHAASAFFPSPFSSAAVLCLDGVGEWATTSLWAGRDNQLTPLWEIDFPHSLGLLYSAFTAYTGFKVNSGEYKLMGLAPYGEPRYADKIYRELIDLKADGTFKLNLDYFNYVSGLTMTNDRFHSLFGGPPRDSDAPVTEREMDLARSIQEVTEEVVMRLARTAHRETREQSLCLAGGVALNCVANGRLVREGPFRDIWVQPAAGDAGGAIGAAYAGWHLYHEARREPREADAMSGSLLGPDFSTDEITAVLDRIGAQYRQLDDSQLVAAVAKILSEGAVVGWFQGRMEFGPRALGNRSILGDPRDREMQSRMNLKIKHRESFRPFAPAVAADRVQQYFDLDRPSPYMTLVAPVASAQRVATGPEDSTARGLAKLKIPRSTIPAVTHVDYSARIQTVHPDTNHRFHSLIREFERLTGCAVLVNTSFNVRGEPIVCDPEDAYRCFMQTDMDYLAVGNCLMDKREQPADPSRWRREFEPD